MLSVNCPLAFRLPLPVIVEHVSDGLKLSVTGVPSRSSPDTTAVPVRMGVDGVDIRLVGSISECALVRRIVVRQVGELSRSHSFCSMGAGALNDTARHDCKHDTGGARVPPTPPSRRRGVPGKWFLCSTWNIMLMILYIVQMFHLEHLWWQYCTYISVRELAASGGSQMGWRALEDDGSQVLFGCAGANVRLESTPKKCEGPEISRAVKSPTRTRPHMGDETVNSLSNCQSLEGCGPGFQRVGRNRRPSARGQSAPPAAGVGGIWLIGLDRCS